MRSKFKFYLIMAIFLILAPGCQRDDICAAATQTTPMLLISFFDAEDPDTPNPVSNLIVRELSFDTIIYNRQNTAEIRIPLRVDSGTTEYEFILNAPADGAVDESNLDRITFTYDPQEIYISRACSFKVNFMNLTSQLNEDDDNWIEEISIVEENIENETDAHIFIYH